MTKSFVVKNAQLTVFSSKKMGAPLCINKLSLLSKSLSILAVLAVLATVGRVMGDERSVDHSAGASVERTADPSNQFADREKIIIKHPDAGNSFDWAGSNSKKEQSKEGSLINLGDIIPLLAVLSLILAVAWAVKRFMPNRRLLTGSKVLEVVARTPLNSKQALVLVKMGGQLLLLGVSADRMVTLSAVDDPDRVATLMGQIAGDRSGSMARAFADSLAREENAYQDEMNFQDPTVKAGGQVRNLLEKIRRFSGPRGVA